MSFPERRTLLGRSFWLVGTPELRRTAEGVLEEYVRALDPGIRGNPHADGPFCRLYLGGAPRSSGVYVVFEGVRLRYVGECQDLSERFGPRGYGEIHQRNCHADGQSTNCKLNARVLAAHKRGRPVTVWFHPCDDRHAVERALISEYSPDWNGRERALPTEARSLPNKRSGGQGAAPRKRDFELALRAILHDANERGHGSLELSAGDLHAKVGGYPGRDHRMPSCCAAMRSLMAPGDRFVYEPPRGDGARLTIEFELSRRA